MVFVLTTILCIWLGYKVHQVKQQKEAVAWVEEHGGSVRYDYQPSFFEHPHAAYIVSGTPPGPKWLHDLIGVDYFIKPTDASLYDKDLDDVSPIVDLPGLKRLGVRSEQVRDLSPLAKLQELKYLDLYCPEAHDLSPLGELKKLKFFFLPTYTTDEEIAKLQEMLPDCQILPWLELE